MTHRLTRRHADGVEDRVEGADAGIGTTVVLELRQTSEVGECTPSVYTALVYTRRASSPPLP